MENLDWMVTYTWFYLLNRILVLSSKAWLLSVEFLTDLWFAEFASESTFGLIFWESVSLSPSFELSGSSLLSTSNEAYSSTSAFASSWELESRISMFLSALVLFLSDVTVASIFTVSGEIFIKVFFPWVVKLSSAVVATRA